MDETDGYDTRTNRRMVAVTASLLVTAVLSIPSPLLGLWFGMLSQNLTIGVTVLMTALSANYLLVLGLCWLQRWQAARSVLFAGWVLYLSTVLQCYHPSQPAIVQILLLNTTAAFALVVQTTVLALAPWRQAVRWILTLLFVGSGSFGILVFRTAQLDGDGVGLITFGCLVLLLSVVMLVPLRVVFSDLEAAVDASREAQLDAQALREDAAHARDRALAANTAKSRFLANMSHELRTPLNAILGYVELIREEADDAGETAYDADLAHIHDAGTHLLGLINAILDLSKIEAGKIEVHDAHFDPSRLVDDLVGTIRPLARQKNLEVRVQATELRELMSDESKIRQVLLNLLSNAVKFTDEGRIELNAWMEPHWFVVTVGDSGVGIAPDRLEAIFDAFERTEAEITRRVGGTGLGLSISRKICELLGGTLTVESQVGEGSTFVVRIPVRPPKRRRTTIGVQHLTIS